MELSTQDTPEHTTSEPSGQESSATEASAPEQSETAPAEATQPEEPQEEIPSYNPAAYIVVFGNEKGGSGKSTTCIHTAISLLYAGYRVSTIDLDSRQRSLTRYIENRCAYAAAESSTLPQPSHFVVNRTKLDSVSAGEGDEERRFLTCLARASEHADFILIDSPGSDAHLSRLAHSYADTIVTPINDSFLDLDVLGTIDGETLHMEKPGIYSEMVWQAKITRAKRTGGALDWVVLRNRLSNLDAHNKRRMAEALDHVAGRLGCRVSEGFSERVIYRELFPYGLTLLDVFEHGVGVNVRTSHVAARQELRNFMDFLDIQHATPSHPPIMPGAFLPGHTPVAEQQAPQELDVPKESRSFSIDDFLPDGSEEEEEELAPASLSSALEEIKRSLEACNA